MFSGREEGEVLTRQGGGHIPQPGAGRAVSRSCELWLEEELGRLPGEAAVVGAGWLDTGLQEGSDRQWILWRHWRQMTAKCVS